MMTTSGSGSISSLGVSKPYFQSPDRDVRSHIAQSPTYDCVSISSTPKGGRSRFHMDMVSRLSKEVRTTTTTGDIQALRQEVASGRYVPDPMAIASRMLFLGGASDMDAPYLDYLSLLNELCGHFSSLCDLAHQKTAAVQHDDLLALDKVLKQEQALALTLRGFEPKRLKQLEALGLSGVPLSKLADAYPSHLRMRAKETAEQLQTQYQLYQAAAEVARNTLECNLHEIEKIVSDMGGDAVSGPGYSSPDLDLPRPMKTDFRA